MKKARSNHCLILIFFWYIFYVSLPFMFLQVKFHCSEFSWISKLFVIVKSLLEIITYVLYSFQDQFITKKLDFKK